MSAVRPAPRRPLAVAWLVAATWLWHLAHVFLAFVRQGGQYVTPNHSPLATLEAAGQVTVTILAYLAVVIVAPSFVRWLWAAVLIGVLLLLAYQGYHQPVITQVYDGAYMVAAVLMFGVVCMPLLYFFRNNPPGKD